MNPIDPGGAYIDSPQRMLVLAMMFMLAVALLMLSNHFWRGPKPAWRAAKSARSITDGANPRSIPVPNLTPDANAVR